METTKQATKYRIVELTADGWRQTEVMGADDLYPAMIFRGYRVRKLNDNHRQRIELQGQPIFDGILGPLWDGDAVRYECPKAHEALSV